MKNVIFLMISMFLVGVGMGSAGEVDVNLKDFMRQKLIHSQKILEGICMEDFDLVEKHAEKMKAMTDAAHFRIIKDKEYLDYMGSFSKRMDVLLETAKKRKLEKVHPAYVDVIQSCVECHHWVRNKEYALLMTPPPQILLAKQVK